MPTTSPDTLPRTGYTEDQLKNYIIRQLGGPVWQIEMTPQQILDCIQDAVDMYSMWRPATLYQALNMQSSIFRYLDEDTALTRRIISVVDVQFVTPHYPLSELYFGNLFLSPGLIGGMGMGDQDTFLRWQKTWERVTSTKPDWLWDEDRRCLYIHNPITRYHCGIVAYGTWDLSKLPFFGANWVKRYATEKARRNYGEILAKYSGAVPGPVRDAQLDTAKRTDGQTKMDALEAELKAAQELTPLSID